MRHIGRHRPQRVADVLGCPTRSDAALRGCHDVGMGEVTDYIAGLDEPARSVLERYRARAVTVVPQAEEGTSYGMAALRYRGRPLVSVVATKQGYSVFPFSPQVVASVIAEFGDFESTKGGIRFTGKRDLPNKAFDALVARRRDEIDAALSKPRRR
jgi:uncharacterized protein YdhG (YjbR/CyaY superfamily)